MKTQLYKVVTSFFILAIVFFLSSCSTTQSDEHKHDGHIHGDEEHKCEQNGNKKHTCDDDEHGEEGIIELSPAQIKEAGITMGTFEHRSLSDKITCNGTIELPPNSLASISVPMDGFVQNIRFLEGAKVKKGQVLVELKHPSYIQLQQDYLKSKSQLDYLEKDLNRQNKLNNAKVSAGKTLQQTKADYNTIVAEVNGLKEQLRFLGISTTEIEKGKIQSTVYLKAPFGGIVTEVNTHKGQLVTPSQVIMEVIDIEHMHVELKVFQKDIPRVKENMPIEFTVPAYNNNEVYKGEVVLVGKNLDLETKTIRVHGHFHESPNLIAGLYVEVNILQTGNKQRVLPEDAVFRDEGNWFFFSKKEVEESGHVVFEKTPFRAGITTGGFTEILSYIGKIDTTSIVTGKAFYLKSEMNKDKGGCQH